MATYLTQDDVTRLMNDPSAETRVETADRVASLFSRDMLSESELALAEQIIRTMAEDVEVKVRESLSRQLKESPSLPHDVALLLARDVDTVALPVLEFSKVLTDEDLIDLVHNSGATKQIAIARRPAVSTDVSEALVDTGDEQVVVALVENDNAEISETSLQKVLDTFPESNAVHEPIVKRATLPVLVAERLVNIVSDSLSEYLVTHHELGSDVAADIIQQSRERATIGLVSGGRNEDIEELIRELHVNGRLTPSIVLRAVCTGDVSFFEVALAVLARVPARNARVLIHDSGPLGLKALFDQANMPASVYPAVRVAMEVLRETDYDGGEHDRERFQRRTIERILTQYDELDGDSLEYLLDKLNQLPQDGIAAA